MIKLYCDKCELKITEKRENIFDKSDLYALETDQMENQLEIRQWVGNSLVLCKPCLINIVEEWVKKSKGELK